MIIDKIQVEGEFRHLQIREIMANGSYHRRVLTPDMDISGEVKEIKAKAAAEWTDEIKKAWGKKQEEQQKKEK